MNTTSPARVLPLLIAGLLLGCARGGADTAAMRGPTPDPSTAVASEEPGADRSTAGSTVVFIVRHAERASATDRDSPLSGAGRARAVALADALAHSAVDAVLTSQFVRSRQTAAPTAERFGLPAAVEPVTDAEASSAALARRVLADHRGETVLVVGHSNTVHLIVRALGGARFDELSESEYDDFFVVIVEPDGDVATVRSRYGAPDGTDSAPGAPGPRRNP